jgi:ligand-binding SRPBCC domain-containing protein
VILERKTLIPAPLPRVFDFFAQPENLARITPPPARFRIVAGPARRLREGDRIDYALRVFGLPFRWTSRIEAWREGESFADVQERGPYKAWRHTHSYRAVAEGTEMHDRVEYELPFGILGRLIAGRLVARELEKIFDYRTQAVIHLLSRI